MLMDGSSRPEVFLEKVVQKICSKFTGEQPYRSVILIVNFKQVNADREVVYRRI